MVQVSDHLPAMAVDDVQSGDDPLDIIFRQGRRRLFLQLGNPLFRSEPQRIENAVCGELVGSGIVGNGDFAVLQADGHRDEFFGMLGLDEFRALEVVCPDKRNIGRRANEGREVEVVPVNVFPVQRNVLEGQMRQEAILHATALHGAMGNRHPRPDAFIPFIV